MTEESPRKPAPAAQPAGPRAARIAVVMGAALVVVGAYFALRPKEPPAAEAHRAGLQAMSDVYLAALHAPEGSTPCESAFNALDAMRTTAAERGLPPPGDMPTRESFLADCSALPAEDQRCMVPRYQSENTDLCAARADRLRTSDAGAVWLRLQPNLGLGASGAGSTPPPPPR